MNIFNLGGPGTAGQDSERATAPAVCSRKGCRSGAQWQLLWNNPRIHTPERRKVWLSCGDHREWLEEYLTTRGLWKETIAFTAGDAAVNEVG
ncbi:hypothetical protein WBN73_11725 [Paenarthrobacter sp. CCNWLY172]|uniref:hypothetical protein n=1 Tax=unclassified Paenarthrobacter TaxID=2634190 RepID=UPI003077E5E3